MSVDLDLLSRRLFYGYTLTPGVDEKRRSRHSGLAESYGIQPTGAGCVQKTMAQRHLLTGRATRWSPCMTWAEIGTVYE
jgi:hypothetical protein